MTVLGTGHRVAEVAVAGARVSPAELRDVHAATHPAERAAHQGPVDRLET